MSEIEIIKNDIIASAPPKYEEELKHVSFNVGNQIFTVQKNLLLTKPNSLLCKIITNELPVMRDTHGNYIINRDPTYFHIMLNSYDMKKDEVVDVSKLIDLNKIKNDLSFYMLDFKVDNAVNNQTENLVIGKNFIVNRTINCAKSYSGFRFFVHNEALIYLNNVIFKIIGKSYTKGYSDDSCSCNEAYTSHKLEYSLWVKTIKGTFDKLSDKIYNSGLMENFIDDNAIRAFFDLFEFGKYALKNKANIDFTHYTIKNVQK